MQPPKGIKPIHLAHQKGEKWVRDPVTGQDVLIKNPQFKGVHYSSSVFVNAR